MRILIVGTLHEQITAASRIAKQRGASVTHAPSADSALSLLRSGKGADILMVDVSLDIKSIITQLQQDRIHIPVLAYGVNVTGQAAASAIKSGAREFVPLPPDEELIAAILASISEDESEIIVTSDSMKAIITMADRIAPSDANILITGESGTGKEVIARYIHRTSKRKSQPFISLNCAAIPENLLESELFGHEKGAFTGATHRRIGKFEEANNGTLLLDEISEMNLHLQAKLLRAIQEREIDRVGGSKPIKLNLRILATTNRILPEEVKKGTFREDLYFRLNVIELNLPPLRERISDIPPLAEHFMKKYTKANGLEEMKITPPALKQLQSHTWPGNVRELENTLHRAVLLHNNNIIDEKSILINGAQPSSRSSSNNKNNNQIGITESLVGRTMESVEQDLIMSTLEHCLGNRTHAANILGISIRTLRNKLKEYEERKLPTG